MNLEELYQQTKLKRSGLRIGRHKRSPPHEWNETRAKVYNRDKGICQSPLNHPMCLGKLTPLPFEDCHIDHTKPLICGGSNHITNLRVLCEVCHALRMGKEHRGLLTRMLKLNKMPDGYENYFWEG